LWLAAICVLASSISSLAAPSIDPIDTMTIPNRTFSALCRLPDGTYAMGGGHSIGEQSWETEPSMSFYGGTSGENTYMVDGMDLSNASEGTVSSFAYDFIEEVQVKSGGYAAEYGGATGAVLDYQNGGTYVINMVTKSGTNEFSSDVFAHTNDSLNDLMYDEEGVLWGAGTTFEAAGPVPVLGYFDAAGTFVPVDNPLEALGGFFNGVEFMGIGLAFGHTTPNGDPTKPLMMVSYNAGATWENPGSLPWAYGTIDTATFLDPLNGWVGGEGPGGGAFAYTHDGGGSWTRQTMPDATYIWDMEIAQVQPDCSGLGSFGDPLSTPYVSDPKILGAALGTYYLDDGSKESIVYRTVDGETWEEMWRVDGYGGDVWFDYRGDGEVAIVQNGLDGNATFSRYAAHDFFGAENLIVCGEIEIPEDELHPNEPFTMQLKLYGPWGTPIEQETVLWTTDYGDLVVDPDNPMQATFTASEPMDAFVTCTLPDRARDLEILRRMGIESEY